MKHFYLSLALLIAACGSNGTGDDNSTGDSGMNGGDGSMQSKDGSMQGQDGSNGDGSMQGMDGSMQNDGGGSMTKGAIKTIFIVMMENHSLTSIQGSKSAPYINKTLLPNAALATNYKTPPGNHPSEPNYIWLEAGDNLGITNDNDPSSNHQATPDHLVTQLNKAGFTWKAYAEDIQAGTCPVTSAGLYGAKHVPQVFFDDVATNMQYCKDHVRPFTELANDLKNNNVAQYNFLVPNLCNDMHGDIVSCNPVIVDEVAAGDKWLSTNVPPIQASSAYTNGGVLFILWDEGDEPLLGTASDGPIPLIVLSPLAKKNYTNQIAYTHSSMLRSVETVFGQTFLRGAQNATDLADLFMTFP